jgi:hypothetical protein
MQAGTWDVVSQLFTDAAPKYGLSESAADRKRNPTIYLVDPKLWLGIE